MADFSQQHNNLGQPPTGINHSADLTNNKDQNSWLESVFTGLVWGFALATAGVLFWMSGIMFKDAYPAIAKFGLSFLWSTQWNIGELQFGALPFIYGTLVSSAIALLLAVPLGLSAAIVTSENFLPIWVRSPLAFLIELIAAIPSVIIGLWGIFVFIPFLRPFQDQLFHYFGWFPLFSTEPFGPGMLTAGMILSIMVLPTIAAISREVLLAIPIDLLSDSMSLGATRWETICYLLVPAGSSGIIGAIILALGRALGETMAVTMVIGNSIQINASLLAPGYTIPSVLATQFREALESLHVGALMYLALLLFLITLLVNFIAALLIYIIGNKAIKN